MRYGILFSDSERELRLNRTSPAERTASTFRHRLGSAGIPFARLARAGAAARSAQAGDEASLERLMVLRERWGVRWTPATDIRLIELAAYGNTLVEVCRRLLRRKLAAAHSLGEAADVLCEVIVGRIAALYAEVLAAGEGASAEDDDFASLSRACYLLDVLVESVALPSRTTRWRRSRSALF